MELPSSCIGLHRAPRKLGLRMSEIPIVSVWFTYTWVYLKASFHFWAQACCFQAFSGASFTMLQISNPAPSHQSTRKPSAYFHFLAECSVWAILELALVVDIINHARSDDVRLQAFLLGNIIKTESPAPAANKSINNRETAGNSFQLSNRHLHHNDSFLVLPDSLILISKRTPWALEES